jgi:transposase
MNQEKPKIYTTEFRESAVKLANESDKPIAHTARDIDVNENTLPTWIIKYSRPVNNGGSVRTDTHLHEELKRLKNEVAQLTEECNFLKNAAYFAKEQRSIAGMQEVGQRRSSCREVGMDQTTRQRIPCNLDVSIYTLKGTSGCFPKCVL